MAVVARLEGGLGWILDHEAFVNETYGPHGYGAREELFDVRTPFRMDHEASKIADVMESGEGEGEPPPKKRRKKRSADVPDRLAEDVDVARKFLEQCRLQNVSSFEKAPSPSVVRANNLRAREAAAELSRRIGLADKDKKEDSVEGDAEKKEEKTGQGGNDTDKLSMLEDGGGGRRFLLPPRSRYVLGDVRDALTDLVEAKETFDAIVVDPPWRNKHVRRTRGYEMLEDEDVGRLPLDKLLSEDGVLVVWCTAAESHVRSVGEWMAGWGMDSVSKAVWLKVTRSGEPVVDLDKSWHKPPFEYVFVGRRRERSFVGDDKESVPVICSVPSAVHSTKPPLVRILSDPPFRAGGSKRFLEVFGRSLLPGWTTVGDQCIHLQDEQCFKKKKIG